MYASAANAVQSAHANERHGNVRPLLYRRRPREENFSARPRGPGLGRHPAPGDGADLRPLLDLCRPRLRAEEARRFPFAQGRGPPGDLLPRSGRHSSTACSTPAATAARSSAPSARATAAVSSASIMAGPTATTAPGRRAGRRRLCGELRQDDTRPAAAGAVRGVSRLLVHVPRSGRGSAPRLSRAAPRTTSTSSSTSRRPARWRSSPACRNTTSPPTGS